MKETKRYPDVRPYLPSGPDIDRVGRQWLCNVVYTIAGPDFAAWVEDKVDARNLRAADTGNLDLELDPEVFKAFKASTQVSSKLSLCLEGLL